MEEPEQKPATEPEESWLVWAVKAAFFLSATLIGMWVLTWGTCFLLSR